MARKPKHEEHENHERWLVSYADFITLLFAFFVVMYSISSVNEGKYRVLSDAVVAAFKSPQKSLKPIQVGNVARAPQSSHLEYRKTTNPIPVPESPLKLPSRASKQEGEILEEEVDFSEFQMAEERLTQEGTGINNDKGKSDSDPGGVEAQLSSLASEVQAAMQPLIDRDLITLKRNRRWLQIEINTSILFASGSAQMQEQSIPILEALSRILAAFPNVMRIEGFTDNLPIKSQIYPSNWELSAARAASVVRLFSAEGIAPERMAAIGYGEFRPVANNDTHEGRVKNRRVVVVVTDKRLRKRPEPKVEKAQPKPEVVPAKEEPVNEVPVNEEPVNEGASKEVSTRVEESLVEDDFLHLDALIESSGLHRKHPAVLDGEHSSLPLQPDPHLISLPFSIPEPLVLPPMKFHSPIQLSPINTHENLPASIDAATGVK